MKYEEIVQDIKMKILKGNWKVGEKLPSLRQLAQKYKTSRNTVVYSFRILKEEGYIFPISAVGYFVNKRKDSQINRQVKIILKNYYDAENKNSDIINFTSIAPFKRYLNNNFISFLLDKQKLIHIEKETTISLISDLLEKEEIFIPESDIFITSSSQLTIEMIIRLLSNKNKLTIAISDPSHYSVINILDKLSKIKGIHLLEDGWDFKDFENILSSEKIDLVYVNPNYQDPSGICWSEEKKQYLLELSEKFDFYIIEEDNYSSLFFDKKLTSFKCLDRIGKERIFYIKDYSKLLGSLIGLTYVAVPDKFKEKFLMEKIVFSIENSKFQENIAYTFLQSEYFNFFLNKIRMDLKNKLNFLVKELKAVPELKIMNIPKGGFFIWLKLNRQIDEDLFYELCKNEGVLILPGYIFYKDERNNSKFRLSFATSSFLEIKNGIKKIKEVISFLKTVEKGENNEV